MSDLVIFVLSSWGLTHLIVSGKIWENSRNWLIIRSSFFAGLLTCYQCSGFWSGLFMSILWTSSPSHMIMMGFISSGVSPLINSVYVWINTSIKRMQDSDKTL